MTLLDHALKLAGKRKPVFPVAPHDKRPLVNGGFKAATTDIEQIRSWWTQWPEANIGMPTGTVSGLVVLDVDVDLAAGIDGEASLLELVSVHGPLPQTLEVRTPRGGRHLYFECPSERVLCSTGALAAHLDMRGDGGYVLVPPSELGAGRYSWINRCQPTPMPTWLRALVVKPEPPAIDGRAGLVKPQPENVWSMPPTVDRLLATGAQAGERNAQAFKLVCQLRDAGLNETEAEVQLLEFAACCSPPLATREALATLRSAYSRPARAPARAAVTVPADGLPRQAEVPSIDEGAFQRLAAMSAADYDRCRKSEAEKLGIRVATLDAEVSERRAPVGGVQGGAVDFLSVDPWPEAVDGAELLDEITDTYTRYVVLPSGAADALALWTAHAHTFEAFLHSPRLNLRSPEKGCGKTTLLDVQAVLVPRPLRTESITPAVLFRLVELHKPVLLLDEVDTYLRDSDELRGLLNAGHKRGAKAYRCEGDLHEVRGFSAFAPAVLAGIGDLPGTLHDRSIVIQLVRAKPGEVRSRFDSRRTAREQELCRMLARWTADHSDKLRAADPMLPEAAYNRLADNWRPLFAIAEVAGGAWPDRAVAAFGALMEAGDMGAHGIGATLLADIATIFEREKTDRLPSARLVQLLAKIEEHPWAEFKGTKPITTNQMARLLGRFNVRPRTIRFGKTAKGYFLEDFADPFARYLPPPTSSKRNSVTIPENKGDSSLRESSHGQTVLPMEGAVSAKKDKPCDGVTVSKPPTEEELLV